MCVCVCVCSCWSNIVFTTVKSLGCLVGDIFIEKPFIDFSEVGPDSTCLLLSKVLHVNGEFK